MTGMLRVVIVDDEAPAREGLRLRLERESNVELIGEYSDPAAALEAIEADPPDLIFLDVQMPAMSGFDVVASTNASLLPPVVFVTAHADYAVRAFGIRALDYLLKPVEQARLHEAIERAREYWVARRSEALLGKVQSIVASVSSPAPSRVAGPARSFERIAVRTDGSIVFVNAEDIDWIDAAGDSVRLHVGRTKYALRKSMTEVLSMLDPSKFARIHRSTIVNIDRIRELQPWFHGEYIVVLKDGSKLKLSRGYRDQLGALMGTV